MQYLVNVGDRLRLCGGYDPEPDYLCGRSFQVGTVERFILGQRPQELVPVVRLDEAITVMGVTGDVLVLELRTQGAVWALAGTVHLELCDFEPENKPAAMRRRGKWIESHAMYEVCSDC